MKALEILKRIYINNPDTRFQRNNIDINFTIHDFSNVNEAIKELEALENRSCEGCKYAKLAKDSSMKEIPNNISTCYHDFKCERYYTDKWESK